MKGGKCLKTVSQTVLISEAKYTIPAHPGGFPVSIQVEIIDSDIPLLLSKDAMKKMGMVLHMDKDYVEIYGKKVMLDTMSAGHYVLPLLMKNEGNKVSADQVYKLEETFVTDFSSATEKEKHDALDKLHKQFGHKSWCL